MLHALIVAFAFAGWLNRFASGAAATINMTQDTVKTVSSRACAALRRQEQHIALAAMQL